MLWYFLEWSIRFTCFKDSGEQLPNMISSILKGEVLIRFLRTAKIIDFALISIFLTLLFFYENVVFCPQEGIPQSR